MPNYALDSLGFSIPGIKMNTGIEKGGQFLKENLFKHSLSLRLRFSRDLFLLFGWGTAI